MDDQKLLWFLNVYVEKLDAILGAIEQMNNRVLTATTQIKIAIENLDSKEPSE